MNGTKVLPCDCKDAQQDAMYGMGMRVHNLGGKGSDKVAYCTVCSPSVRRLRITPEVDRKTGQLLAPKIPVPAADKKGKKF